jgi:hypothetical protein
MLRDMSQSCRQDAMNCPPPRGYSVAYRADAVNFCPGCGRSHWYIGRLLAECGFCGTAIPLQATSVHAVIGGHGRNHRSYMPSSFAA